MLTSNKSHSLSNNGIEVVFSNTSKNDASVPTFTDNAVCTPTHPANCASDELVVVGVVV